MKPSGTCSTHTRTVYILVENHEEKRPLGRPRYRGEKILKRRFKKSGIGYGMAQAKAKVLKLL
jgi:hypothetical protein